MLSGNDQARRRIQSVLLRGRIPGCSVAVMSADTEVQAGSLGFADLRTKRPATNDTTYPLFSGTKLYTAAALMRLRERGMVRLDEPVTTYLGDLPLRHSVTLRQLASHDSGLRDTPSAFFAVHLPGEPAPSTAEALARYRLDRGTRPGGGAAYRNVNYAILGEVISRVSGQPYASFVRDTLLAPLGAPLVFECDDTETAAHAATGYMTRFGPMRWLLRAAAPGLLPRIEGRRIRRRIELSPCSLDTAAIGGLIGSARAFMPFLAEFLSDGDGVLTAESKRHMLTLQAQGRAGVVSRRGVGLGWKLGRLDDGTEFWNHEGGGPGFTSETRLYPADRIGAVVLLNTTHTKKLSWFAHRICEILRAACRD